MIHITRSELSDHNRCERKYRYRHVDEVEPEFAMGSIPMRQGTLGHYGLQAGYNWMRLAQSGQDEKVSTKEQVESRFIDEALEAMAAMVRQGTYQYRGETQPLGLPPEEKAEEIRAIGDAVQFYARHKVWDDFNRYRIIATEIPFDVEYEIDMPDSAFKSTQKVTFSGVFDFMAEDMTHQNNRVIVVGDHKFVGNVNDTMAFLPLDIQMLSYESMVARVMIGQHGYDDAEIMYNMIRREVPPGFGHRPMMTPTGRKSTASQDPEDYLKRTILNHSRRERESIESNFLIPSLKRVVMARTETGPLIPTVIRTGGEACVHCDFFARCKANLIGRGQPRFVPGGGAR